MAMLTRYDPFRDLFRLQDALSRNIDDRLGVLTGESVGWAPACDIFEDGEGVSVRFELAGVDPKDVDIRFENGLLTMRGERKLEREEKKENYHRIEMQYGSFSRSFSLPRHHRRGEDPRRVEERRADRHLAEEGRGQAAAHPGEGHLVARR